MDGVIIGWILLSTASSVAAGMLIWDMVTSRRRDGKPGP